MHVRVVGIAVLCGLASQLSHPPGVPSDFSFAVAAARAWWTGGDPYGPFFDSQLGVFYPFPAILLALPVALTPWPEFVFITLSIGLWGWAIRDRPWAWWALPSWAGIFLVRYAQWDALLTGSALIPWAGFLLVCKPPLGLALFTAYPSRRALYGGLGVTLASLAIWPGWPEAWARALSTGWHFQAPVTQWGGPLILLALAEWRRPEARLLVALACVPQTPSFYGLFPLFLIPRGHGEGMGLFCGVMGILMALGWTHEPAMGDMAEQFRALPSLLVWGAYLPCTLMVLWPRLKAWFRRAPSCAGCAHYRHVGQLQGRGAFTGWCHHPERRTPHSADGARPARQRDTCPLFVPRS
jgi:hypothetical protein